MSLNRYNFAILGQQHRLAGAFFIGRHLILKFIMRKTHFLAIPLLAASGLNIHAEPNSQFVIQVNAESLNYSESMPIKQFMDELKGPKPDSGDIAFTFNHAEINLSWRNINVSLFQRLDYLLE